MGWWPTSVRYASRLSGQSFFYDVSGRTGLHIEMDTYRRLAVCLVLLVQALNGQAALKAAGRLDQTAMRLSDLGSDEGQVVLA